MDLKKITAALSVIAMTAAFTGCGEKGSSSDSSDSSPSVPQTENATEAELEPPTPAECSDPNAVTFDDGDLSFADVKLDDPDSAQGELEIVSVNGNPMLKFVDSGTNFADGTVQKIKFDGAKMLSAENLAKVRSIEMDVYADATSDAFVNEDDENVKAPGWIGGGGGASLPNGKWYEFAEWEGGEYNFEMSGAIHVELKFLLAVSGQCWDDTMTEATFQIMRWGAQNEGSLYVDNIVFKDEDGNSLPIEISAVSESDESPTDAPVSDESSKDATISDEMREQTASISAEFESRIEKFKKKMEESEKFTIPADNSGN
ncbi:MAG: hypothetical protein J6B75_07905 [Ruminococcus sp.]|nr:hypothetical protein [Ruminococcus sp.]